MSDIPYRSALIIGAGHGISGSLTRLLRALDIPVVIAARNTEKLASLIKQTGAIAIRTDATEVNQIERLFAQTDAKIGAPELVIYNASGRARGPIADLNPAVVAEAVAVTAMGAFYSVQQAAKRMVPAGRGAILLTGATAGIKGFANSAPFAMGKFALRGLAQSAARELGPKGIHVAHFIIDGSVRPADHLLPHDISDGFLDPDAIAQSYLNVLQQPRNAWSHEIDLRPWTERF